MTVNLPEYLKHFIAEHGRIVSSLSIKDRNPEHCLQL